MTGELEIPPAQAAELLSNGEAHAVDVREDYEWDAGHIAGARHIELGELAGEADSLGGTTIFYCRSGERSMMAAQAFAASGKQVYSVSGGLLAWQEAGLPLEPDGGSVADRSPLP